MADRSLPARPDLQQYKKQAKELLKSARGGDRDALRRIRDHHPRFANASEAALREAALVLADAQLAIARAHDFESWQKFAAHIKAVTGADSAVAEFEDAVDAIVRGDIETLTRLLARRPDLIRARSTRRHHSTLLHYVGANGVEGYRQRTPKNAVQVAAVLLDAGSEIDAVADMYGGATTLGLVATSCHPRDAGVQSPLIDVFLARGARMDRPGVAGGDYPLVNSCLANGRPEAAAYVADRGAPVDLEGAAGLGRLDLVQTFFTEDGQLTKGATPTQMRDGFSWACEYGRADVVEFLLQHGMDVGARLRPHKQTGLHWAAIGPHIQTVKVLLRHGSPLDVRDASFDGTPLGWTIYGWSQQPDDADRSRYYDVIALLVAVGAPVEPQWLSSPYRGVPLVDWMKGDVRMQEALAGRRVVD
jgi:Ankyrin repeats (3 copies)